LQSTLFCWRTSNSECEVAFRVYSSRGALEYWASRLERIYFKEAFARARHEKNRPPLGRRDGPSSSQEGTQLNRSDDIYSRASVQANDNSVTNPRMRRRNPHCLRQVATQEFCTANGLSVQAPTIGFAGPGSVALFASLAAGPALRCHASFSEAGLFLA